LNAEAEAAELVAAVDLDPAVEPPRAIAFAALARRPSESTIEPPTT
jgi:hypothetical protein